MSYFPDKSNNIISAIVTNQLPEYVNESYPNFVAFVEAYYEYLEQEGKLINNINNFTNYLDIDYVVENNISGFIQSFENKYLKGIPTNILVDKAKLLKHIRTFYNSRGTSKSFQFLFRILFNETIDIIYSTETLVLKASAGQWYQPTVIRINPSSTLTIIGNLPVLSGSLLGLTFVLSKSFLGNNIVLPTNFFNSNTGIMGESLVLGNSYLGLGTIVNFSYGDISDWVNMQIYGETSYASAVVSSVNQNNANGISYNELTISNITKSFLPNETIVATLPSGNTISATTLGIINSIQVINSGTGYNVGDPVIITGGGGSNASAVVSSISEGSLLGISIIDGGSGFKIYPNYFVHITGNETLVPVAEITGIDTSGLISPNTYYINTDTINNLSNNFLTISANTNLVNTWNSVLYNNCGPLQLISVISGGEGFTSTPTLNIAPNLTIGNTNLTIDEFGSIGRFTILNAGKNYKVNDSIKVVSTYSRGFGGEGVVTSVNSAGSITSVYVALPSISGTANVIASSNNVIGNNTNFSFELTANNNSSYPNSGSYVSINGEIKRVANIVNNTFLTTETNFVNTATNQYVRLQGMPLGGFGYKTSDIVNGLNITVSSVTGGTGAVIGIDSLLGSGSQLVATAGTYGQVESIKMIKYGDHYTSIPNIDLTHSGDGKATAIAQILSPEFQYPGYFLNEDGMLSSRRYLQDALNYNSYTYALKSPVIVQAYNDIVYNILNPAGMNMKGIVAIDCETGNTQDINNNGEIWVEYITYPITIIDGP